MAVWLMQLLCPKRHCILAAPYDPTRTSVANLQHDAQQFMLQEALNPWCALCGSTDLTFEHTETPFHSLTDIEPLLRDLAEAQAQTNKQFGRF